MQKDTYGRIDKNAESYTSEGLPPKITRTAEPYSKYVLSGS